MSEDVVINVLEKGSAVAASEMERLAAAATKASTTTNALTGAVKSTYEAQDKLSGVTRTVVVEDGKLVSATERVTSAVKQQDTATKSLEKTQRSAVSAAELVSRTFAGLVTAASVKNIISSADAWTNYANQLRSAGVEQSKLAKTQSDVADIARRSNTDLGATNQLYAQLTRNSKGFNATQADVARVTETVNKSFQLSGAASGEASNSIRQLNQAFASGVLRGDEFNSIMENAPALARIAAKEFTGSADALGKLREMAERGEISTRRLFDAIRRSSGDIDTAFAKSTQTVSQALTNLNTSWQQYIGNTNNATGTTNALAAAINFIGANLNGIVTGVGLLTGAWVAYRIAVTAAGVATAAASAIIAASPVGRVIALLGTLAAAWAAVGLATAEGRAKLMEYVTAAGTALASVGTFVTGAVAFFEQLGTSIYATWTSFVEGVDAAFTAAYETIVGWYDKVVELFTVTLPNGINAGLTVIGKYFSDAFDSVYNYVKDVIDNIASYFNNFVDRIKSILSSLAQTAQSIGNAISGGGGNANVEARASGGPTKKGQQYLIGENGPELWTAPGDGYVIPNGGSTGAAVRGANDNRTAPSRSLEMLTDAVTVTAAIEMPFKALTDIMRDSNRLLGELVDFGKTTAASTTTVADAVQAAAGSPTNGQSAINNFGLGGLPAPIAAPSVPSAPASSVPPIDNSSSFSGSSGPALGAGGAADKATFKYYVDNYTKALKDERTGLRAGKNSRVQYWYDLTPPDIRDRVIGQASTNAFGAAFNATVNFRSGGDFTVPGSTGADSKVIPLGLTPGEEVKVRSRAQVRADEENQSVSSEGNVYNFNVYTQDADSFKRSEKQVRREFLTKLALAQAK